MLAGAVTIHFWKPTLPSPQTILIGTGIIRTVHKHSTAT